MKKPNSAAQNEQPSQSVQQIDYSKQAYISETLVKAVKWRSDETVRNLVNDSLDKFQSINTIQFRQDFGIASPAPRILELRHDYDINIQEYRVTFEDSAGIKHKGISCYFKLAGKWSESPEGIASAKKRGVDHE